MFEKILQWIGDAWYFLTGWIQRPIVASGFWDKMLGWPLIGTILDVLQFRA